MPKKLTSTELPPPSVPKHAPQKKRLVIIAAVLLLLSIGVAAWVNGLVIAALVNGQPITRLQVIRELERQGGQRVLENLITETLILQEGKRRSVTVTETEIDAEIASAEVQLAKQGENLDTLLASQGVTRKEIRKQILLQKLSEKLLADQTTVSEEELTPSLDKNSDEASKAAFREQLTGQKIAQALPGWLETLRQQASIQTFVQY
ncbi:MAG: SurA N-terminal domain-containing protein [bacterium]|nr:SurA N-terminal domain-containing protein [bacterium]